MVKTCDDYFWILRSPYYYETEGRISEFKIVSPIWRLRFHTKRNLCLGILSFNYKILIRFYSDWTAYLESPLRVDRVRTKPAQEDQLRISLIGCSCHRSFHPLSMSLLVFWLCSTTAFHYLVFYMWFCGVKLCISRCVSIVAFVFIKWWLRVES